MLAGWGIAGSMGMICGVETGAVFSQSLRLCVDQTAIGLEVPLAGVPDDLLGYLWGRRLPIPAQSGHIIPHKLLVEAWFRSG